MTCAFLWAANALLQAGRFRSLEVHAHADERMHPDRDMYGALGH